MVMQGLLAAADSPCPMPVSWSFGKMDRSGPLTRPRVRSHSDDEGAEEWRGWSHVAARSSPGMTPDGLYVRPNDQFCLGPDGLVTGYGLIR
jgi:hypothetical protein